MINWCHLIFAILDFLNLFKTYKIIKKELSTFNNKTVHPSNRGRRIPRAMWRYKHLCNHVNDIAYELFIQTYQSCIASKLKNK